MVPVHTSTAWHSPFTAEAPDAQGMSRVMRGSIPIASISFPKQPRFYAMQTFDGVPYSHIATLHGSDVLATTVLQTCIRYESRRKSCKFCAIGQSLAAGRTVARKTPEQLAEVARAAVLLDGVKHMVMTTGTPNATDRGAAILCESAFAIKAAVDIPDPGPVRAARRRPVVPPHEGRGHRHAGHAPRGGHARGARTHHAGQGQRAVSRYMSAFEAAVGVFGRGQVSTYILAGLGDTREAILDVCDQLLARGVYPFVVPFVPISGTPLEDHPAPTPEFMKSLLAPLGERVVAAGLRSADIKAGCGKCGACSSLSIYEKESEG
jgi:radical SAM protein (TIGR04043 family)